MENTEAPAYVPVYEFLAHQLQRSGIGCVFGLMSEDTAQLVATLDAIGVRFYSARHENNAIGMAEGHASATGSLSVALIGRGPATANGLHAAAYAARTGSPLLLLVGDAPLQRGANGFGPDTKRFASPEVLGAAGLKVFRPTSVAHLPICLADAMRHAAIGQTAVLLLPVDVQKAAIPMAQEKALGAQDPRSVSRAPRMAAVTAASTLLANAKRPLIVAGRGAWLAGAGKLLETLADRIGAVLCTTLKAKDMFAGHPFHVGLIGSFSFSVGRRFYEQADCILVVGAGLNQRTTSHGRSLPPDVPVIHVDLDRSHIGRWFHADVGIVGDACRVIEALLESLPAHAQKEVGFHSAKNREFIAQFDRATEFSLAETARTVDPRALGMRLNSLMPRERQVVYDAGNFLGILQYIDVPSPAQLKNTSEFGSIGLGLSTAMGVAEGNGSLPTYLFVGDGGLLMVLGELETVAREGIPLVILVINDCAYGAETHFLRQHDMPVAKSLFADIDFAEVATQFGIESATIRSLADLESISSQMVRPQGPLLLDCKVNGQVAAAFTAEHA